MLLSLYIIKNIANINRLIFPIMLTFDLESVKFSDEFIIFRGRNASKLSELNCELSEICYFANHLYCPEDERFFECRANLIHMKMLDLSDYFFTCIAHLFAVFKQSSPAPSKSGVRSMSYLYDFLLKNVDLNFVFRKKTSASDFFIVFLYSYYCYVLYMYNPHFCICKERMIIKNNQSDRIGKPVELDLDSDLPF